MRTMQCALQSAMAEQNVSSVDKRIDDVVVQLQNLARRTGLAFAIGAGRLIIDSFYGGTIDRWREKGTKHASFRRLARRPDLPMSATSLYRCVAIYDLYTRLPALSAFSHVTVSHARAVLPLGLGMQETMLERAEEKKWSVAKLEAEVSALRPEPSRRLRAGVPPLVKMLQRLRATLDDEESALSLAKGHPSDDGQLLDTLQSIRAACEQLEIQIRGQA